MAVDFVSKLCHSASDNLSDVCPLPFLSPMEWNLMPNRCLTLISKKRVEQHRFSRELGPSIFLVNQRIIWHPIDVP